MLAMSGEALPIHEPFNPSYPLNWLADPPQRWFSYVAPGSDEPLREQMQRVIDLRPAGAAMLRRNPRPKLAARTIRQIADAALGRRRGQRALLKDPIAFFSAPWIANEFDAAVVVLLRHPAAFAGSLKRLSWTFDFTNLTSQPALLDRLPSDLAPRIAQASKDRPDIIDTSILLWQTFARIADAYRQEHPAWHVMRHEDLAADPVEAFRRLYPSLGLTWSAAVESKIRSMTGEHQVSDVDPNKPGGVVRNSRSSMWTWQNRLTPGEIDRVREGTRAEAVLFYEDLDWEPSAH
jgi:hypothetical protein